MTLHNRQMCAYKVKTISSISFKICVILLPTIYTLCFYALNTMILIIYVNTL